MVGLWADGWFYIYSAGLLVSGVLFIFLLGQYRIASEAADATEVEVVSDKDAHGSPIHPVYTPDASPAPKVVSHAETPAPKMPDAVAESRRDPANTTGGVSPAVVYLQNIKTELAELHKEMSALAKRVDERLAEGSTRDEALIERLGELASAVDAIRSAAPAPEAPAPAPKKARKAEKAPEPAAAEPVPESVVEPKAAVESVPAEIAAVTLSLPPEPVPAPVAAPVIEPFPEPEPAPARKKSDIERRADETIRMDLSGLVAPEPKPAEPAAEPASAPETPPEEKPRRGPVWPV